LSLTTTTTTYYYYLCTSSHQAAAGWPISELCDRQLAAWFGFEPLLDSHDRAPSLFDNWKGLAAVPPAFWGFLFGLTAVIELEYGMMRSKRTTNLAKQQDPDYFPGKLGLDPLGFYPHTAKGRRRMQLAEIKHGRLAMIAVVIYCLAEYITKEGIIDEVESFLNLQTTAATAGTAGAGAVPFFPMLFPAETIETELVERFAGME
jgi:Chlorophyll A-B binding protein